MGDGVSELEEKRMEKNRCMEKRMKNYERNT
jgi:hypothetical protein